jgi:hypothetical protein
MEDLEFSWLSSWDCGEFSVSWMIWRKAKKLSEVRFTWGMDGNEWDYD